MRDLTITAIIKVYQYDELNEADRALVTTAKEATARSYVPYSHFSVVQPHCGRWNCGVRHESGKCGLSVGALCRTYYPILCQLPVPRPARHHTCYRRQNGERLY